MDVGGYQKGVPTHHGVRDGVPDDEDGDGEQAGGDPEGQGETPGAVPAAGKEEQGSLAFQGQRSQGPHTAQEGAVTG